MPRPLDSPHGFMIQKFGADFEAALEPSASDAAEVPPVVRTVVAGTPCLIVGIPMPDRPNSELAYLRTRNTQTRQAECEAPGAQRA